MGRSYGELIPLEPEPAAAPRVQNLRRVRRPEHSPAGRKGFGDLVALVQQASAVDDDTLQFFARGMLMNVVASIDMLDADEAWAKKVLTFCERETDQPFCRPK